jgi:hypothetical protein
MKIPAGAKLTTHDYSYSPTAYFGYCRNEKDSSPFGGLSSLCDTFKVYTAALHQYGLGIGGLSEVRKSDEKTKQCLIDIPR